MWDFKVDKKNLYRLWYGNKATDWIDIKSERLGTKDTEIFNDSSPIEKIYDYSESCVLLIEKKKSIWKLWYGKEETDFVLRLISPIEKDRVLIYKRCG